MIRTVLLVAALLALSEGAVLVRFINTVPTRGQFESTPTASTPLTVTRLDTSVAGAESVIDRVGLQYFAQSTTTGNVASPTLVWTSLLTTTDVTPADGTFSQPYAWLFAMPPLRAYHSIKLAATAETIAVDKPYGNPPHCSPPTAACASADNNGIDVFAGDIYEQTRLQADGVGLYMVFAAGTYQMQAYAAISSPPSINGVATTSAAARLINQVAAARAFQDSSVSFTFADNQVYTIIAYGAGQFGATTPLSGNTVRLALIQESVAPTTFGMAAIRFFNAFAASGVAMDVYSGTGVSDATRIASSIAVGSVSAYVDVAPGTLSEFPVAATGSTANYLASGINVRRDVRAGSRQTVICGINNEANAQGFCRGIPSRVVAYVRLVNDNAGQDSLVQGKFGAQKLSQTNLHLFASYEYPRPEQVSEQSQVMNNIIFTSHPATTDGLYPVIVNAAPGTVTGYGEVFVPVFIMDYAVRWVIRADPNGLTGSNADFANVAAGTMLYFFAPVYKRVNLIVKTEGMATMTGAAAGTDFIFPFVGSKQVGKNLQDAAAGFTNFATGTQALTQSITLDNLMEAGEYYSFIVSPAQVAVVAPNTPLSYQRGSIVMFYMRQDRAVDTVSTGITSGKGILNLVAFGAQDFSATAPDPAVTFSIQLSNSNAVANTPALGTFGKSRTVALVAGNKPIYPTTSDQEISLIAGTYTFSYSGGNAACNRRIPASGSSINVSAGKITDLFVLNVYGCVANSNDIQRLALLLVTRDSAQNTGNSPFAASTRAAAAATEEETTTSRHAVPFGL